MGVVNIPSAKEQFYEYLYRVWYLDTLENREKEIHVTDITSDCLREVVLSKVIFKLPRLSKLLYFWWGVMVHQNSFFGGEKEFTLEWRGINARIDEYDKGKGYLLEKKTIEKLPREAYEHHIRQVLYYYVILVENGYEVNKAEIVYFARDGCESFELDLKPYKTNEKYYNDLKLEMLNKRDILLKHLQDRTLPDRVFGWWCDYCSYKEECFICSSLIDDLIVFNEKIAKAKEKVKEGGK
jgi:CRISPR/Cas system-associated exonuclease Cas4 (RecB family)